MLLVGVVLFLGGFSGKIVWGVLVDRVGFERLNWRVYIIFIRGCRKEQVRSIILSSDIIGEIILRIYNFVLSL